MSYTWIDVPAPLLYDPNLKNSDKVLWIYLHHDKKNKSIKNLVSPTRLAERTGLSRPTIYTSLERLAAAGWYQAPRPTIITAARYNRWVNVPLELLTNSELKLTDIVTWAKLKAQNSKGCFTIRVLSEGLHLCAKTLRRAIKALQETHWLKIWKKRHQRALTFYDQDTPITAQCRYEFGLINKILKNKIPSYGEALARCVVGFLVGLEKVGTARPGELINPKTGMPLEIDIYIAEYKVAIEFQGPQHYRPTSYSTARDVAKQQQRDALKAALLKNAGYTLIELRPEEMDFDKIKAMLQPLVPIRNLSGLGEITCDLRTRCHKCRRWALERQAEEQERQQAQMQMHMRPES